MILTEWLVAYDTINAMVCTNVLFACFAMCHILFHIINIGGTKFAMDLATIANPVFGVVAEIMGMLHTYRIVAIQTDAAMFRFGA